MSRAFQILSDPDKKERYDKFGGDPDSRFNPSAGPSGASPFSGFSARPAGAGGMFNEEISPEELFNRFFGGGGMGGMGGPGGGFSPFGMQHVVGDINFLALSLILFPQVVPSSFSTWEAAPDSLFTNSAAPGRGEGHDVAQPPISPTPRSRAGTYSGISCLFSSSSSYLYFRHSGLVLLLRVVRLIGLMRSHLTPCIGRRQNFTYTTL